MRVLALLRDLYDARSGTTLVLSGGFKMPSITVAGLSQAESHHLCGWHQLDHFVCNAVQVGGEVRTFFYRLRGAWIAAANRAEMIEEIDMHMPIRLSAENSQIEYGRRSSASAESGHGCAIYNTPSREAAPDHRRSAW